MEVNPFLIHRNFETKEILDRKKDQLIFNILPTLLDSFCCRYEQESIEPQKALCYNVMRGFILFKKVLKSNDNKRF